MPSNGAMNRQNNLGTSATPSAPSLPSQAMGSFGYMQNPMMSGAGMPRGLPMQASGRPMKPAPMYQPRPVRNARV